VRGERTLFAGLSFALKGGELLRIGGPNGSGKTSLLRIACGCSSPDRAKSVGAARTCAGSRRSSGAPALYRAANALKDDLTAAENLGVACALAGIVADDRQIGEALRMLGWRGARTCPPACCLRGSVGAWRWRGLRSARIRRCGCSTSLHALDAAAIDCVQGLIGGHVSRGGGVSITPRTTKGEHRAAVSRRIDLAGS